MKTIDVSTAAFPNKFTIVDDADFAWLSKWKWQTRSGSYATRSVAGTKIFMHREIAKPNPGQVVDHVNGNTLDNTRVNLRVCSYVQNGQNRKKDKLCRSSIFKGVRWHARAKKFYAQIVVNKRAFHLGSFASEVDAAKAYNSAAEKHFGPFAHLNNFERGMAG